MRSADSDVEAEARALGLCFRAARGEECPQGDMCPLLHADTPAEHERVATVRPPRRTKGKGKGKREAETTAAGAFNVKWSATS